MAVEVARKKGGARPGAGRKAGHPSGALVTWAAKVTPATRERLRWQVGQYATADEAISALLDLADAKNLTDIAPPPANEKEPTQ